MTQPRRTHVSSRLRLVGISRKAFGKRMGSFYPLEHIVGRCCHFRVMILHQVAPDNDRNSWKNQDTKEQAGEPVHDVKF